MPNEFLRSFSYVRPLEEPQSAHISEIWNSIANVNDTFQSIKQQEKNKILKEVERVMVEEGAGQNAPGLVVEGFPTPDIQIYQYELVIAPTD